MGQEICIMTQFSVLHLLNIPKAKSESSPELADDTCVMDAARQKKRGGLGSSHLTF